MLIKRAGRARMPAGPLWQINVMKTIGKLRFHMFKNWVKNHTALILFIFMLRGSILSLNPLATRAPTLPK